MKYFRCSTSSDKSPMVDEMPSYYKKCKGIIWLFVIMGIVIFGKIGTQMNNEKNEKKQMENFQEYIRPKCQPGSVWSWPSSVTNTNTIPYTQYIRYPSDEFKPRGFDLIFQRYPRVYGLCTEFEPKHHSIVLQICPEGSYFDSKRPNFTSNHCIDVIQ